MVLKYKNVLAVQRNAKEIHLIVKQMGKVVYVEDLKEFRGKCVILVLIHPIASLEQKLSIKDVLVFGMMHFKVSFVVIMALIMSVLMLQ